jgi:hypothetical protein
MDKAKLKNRINIQSLLTLDIQGGVGACTGCAGCPVAFGKGCLCQAVACPARHQAAHLGTPVAAGVAQVGQQYAALTLAAPGGSQTA